MMTGDAPPTRSIATCPPEAAGDVVGLLPDGTAVETRSSVGTAARRLVEHAVETAIEIEIGTETVTATETVIAPEIGSRIGDAVGRPVAGAAHATA